MAVSKKSAFNKIRKEISKGQHIFSHIVSATDPETGKIFPFQEFCAESALLMMTGRNFYDS